MKATANRIFKNISAIFISQVCILALSTVLTVYVARLLGVVNYGKYVFASTFPLLFFTSLDFFNDICVREVAKDKSRATEYLSNLQFLKILTSVILLATIYFSTSLMGYPADTATAILVFSVYFFFVQLNNSIASIFTANEKLGYPAISAAVEKAVAVSIALYVLFSGRGLTVLVWAFVIGSVLRYLFLSVAVRRYAGLKLKFDAPLWRYLLKTGYPLLIGSFIVILLSRSGVLFLSWFKGDRAVGIYGIGFGLYVAAAIIPTSVTGALFPLFSRYHKESAQAAGTLYKASFRLLFFLAVLITTGVLALGREIVSVFFKQEYLESVFVLKLIFVTLPLFFLRNLLALVLLSINRQILTLIGLGVALFFNLILNLMLIPPFGYVGAGISFVISECIIFCILLWGVTRYFCQLELLDMLFKSMFIAFLTFLFLYYFRVYNLFLISGLGAGLYIFLAFLTRFFPEGELAEIKAKIF